MKKALIFLCALSLVAFAVPAFADYIAVGGWDSGAVYILDNGFNLKSSFATEAVGPDAVATDGKYIYSGHFEIFILILHLLVKSSLMTSTAKSSSAGQGRNPNYRRIIFTIFKV